MKQVDFKKTGTNKVRLDGQRFLKTKEVVWKIYVEPIKIQTDQYLNLLSYKHSE